MRTEIFFNGFYWTLRQAVNVARIGERRGAYSVLVGKREGKRPLGRPRRSWEDNIKTDLQYEGVTRNSRTEAIAKYMTPVKTVHVHPATCNLAH
jgi:hypothetical protein